MEKADKEETKTGKELMLERLLVKHPDMDAADDEALYQVINSDYDTYEQGVADSARMKDSLDKMLDVFDRYPEAASLYVELARGGKSVIEYLLERYGDDFKLALEDRDPEVISKIAEAESKYRERVSKDNELREEAKRNLVTTLDALDAAAEEAGVDDEVKDAAFEQFANVVDDAIRDKVSKETWMMFIKGITHDSDVESALAEGEVRGRNTRIKEALRKPSERVPPAVGGQGGTPRRQQGSGFLENVQNGDWYTRAFGEK